MSGRYNFIFGFPIYQSKIDPSNYDKDRLIRDITTNYEKDQSRNKWSVNSDLHHSYNDLDNSNFIPLNYKSLIPIYRKEIQKFIDTLSFRKEISWNFHIANYTATKYNQYMASHHHVPSVFSAVHYIKFDKKNHFPTVFENVNGYIDYVSMLYPEIHDIMTTDINNSWIYPEYHPNVSEDDIIIFPSALKHHIRSSKSDTLRVTISLNISFTEDRNDSNI